MPRGPGPAGRPDTVVVVLRRIRALDGPAIGPGPPRPPGRVRAAAMRARPAHRRRLDGSIGQLRFRWSGAAEAPRTGRTALGRPDRGRGRDHTTSSSRSARPRLRPGRRSTPRSPGAPPRQLDGSRADLAGRGRRTRDARQAYAVLRGLTSADGRHGRRGDDEPARAGRGEPQLRLPLRLDPRPVLRRPGRGRATAPSRCSTARSASCPTGCSPTVPTSSPPTPSTAARCPTSAALTIYRATRAAIDKVGNWVNQQFQLDAFGEALLLFAAAARHDRLDSEHWKAVESRGRGDRHPLARARRRHLGTRRPTTGPTPG